MSEFHFSLRVPAPERQEKLLEVQLLAAVRDINNFVRMPLLQPVLKRGQIRGGVIKPAIALLDQSRIRLPFTVAIDQEWIFLGRQCAVAEDGFGSFALPRDAQRSEER